MSRYNFICFIAIILNASFIFAQEHFPYNGMKAFENKSLIIDGGHLHFSNGTVVHDGMLIVEDGVIIYAGKKKSNASGFPRIELPSDHHIYPGIIDLFSDYGMPEAKDIGENHKMQPQMLSDKPGAYSWNEAIRPEFSAAKEFKVDLETRKKHLEMGVTSVVSQQFNGLSRGSAVWIDLCKNDHEAIVMDQLAHAMSFKKGKSSQNYPSSLMGAIALIKQTHHDAEWIEHSEGKDLSLQSWNEMKELPLLFEVSDKWEAFNAMDLADYMGREIILKGNNDEYQRMDEFVRRNPRFILPLTFPKAMQIDDPIDLNYANYADMKHWELAPYNAFMLESKGISFVFTLHGLKNTKEFIKALKNLKDSGLDEKSILQAMSATPAKWMGMEDGYGDLKEGMKANFFITENDIFNKRTKIKQTFIEGLPDKLVNYSRPNQGIYSFTWGDNEKVYHLKELKGKLTWFQASDSSHFAIKLEGSQRVGFSLKGKDSTDQYFFSGMFDEDGMQGIAMDGSGESFYWSAIRTGPLEDEGSKQDSIKSDVLEDQSFDPFQYLIYPFQAYGQKDIPDEKKNLIFKNVTCWTNADSGIIKNGDVWIQNGKIQQVGQNLSVSGAEIIDATGLHLTSGIIDEHSHIAIRKGVNEGTQVSSAEVSIADVINPDDVNIFRHIAGGVTALQQLHGSANPIGGQSSLIKLRWGKHAEAMKINQEDGFIKFALGENVKQSNWGDNNRIRYPQTRMGVEQVYEEYFTRAIEYEKEKERGLPYRKDIELEVLLEVLKGERFVTCHSYQQGEINMLMQLAERYQFRINTFTHILEGYKIADKLKKHGAGASSFSDWWAYKYEVIDAIPYNSAILNEMGIVTAINSDDAEMGRRLNQEAAKAMKYGGVSEEDAWKMVTLNPAKLLHLDDRMGSIEVGKDADLVLWSASPLSSYAQVQQTYIDGIEYYNLQNLKQLELKILEEKRRIAEKMKKDSGKKKEVEKKEEKHYHCDDVADELKG